MATLHGQGTPVSRNGSFIPSPMDLLMTFPRLAQRAGAFALFYLPEQLDGLLSKATGNKSLASSTTSYITSAISASTSIPTPTETAQPGSFSAFGENLMTSMPWTRRATLSRIGNFESVYGYVVSKWALSTFAIAIILNRTQVYASSRRHLNLNWKARLLLRSLPILAFLYQIVIILQTMRCQTGPAHYSAKLADSGEMLFGGFAGEGGLLHQLSSKLLFWQDDTDSCVAAGMLPMSDDLLDFSGSLSVLWPLFLSLCLSHFVENLSCALQGRQPMAETGMTIFEHSLAFAEAEAIVRSSLGLSVLGWPRHLGPTGTSTTTSAAPTQSPEQVISVTASMLMNRSNVPSGVLFIALVSSCSHLSTNILALLGLQARFRLVNTGIWGISLMTAFFWSFVSFSRPATDADDLGVLRYPTVCIVGFMPHFFILLGIVLCGFIYLLALTITVISPPSKQHAQGTWRDRIRGAHHNLQSNVSLSTIEVSWQEEFYTTLLKIGFTVLTAASEAIYFNEGTTVTMSRWTWLEAKRYEDFATARGALNRTRSIVPTELQGDSSIAEGVGLIEEDGPLHGGGSATLSGFARERKTTKRKPSKVGAAATREEGVGGSQRSGRWLMSWIFCKEIALLLLRFWATSTLYVMWKFGIRQTPEWLQQLAVRDKVAKNSPRTSNTSGVRPLQQIDFWMELDSGELSRPRNLNVDVEHETRKRFRRAAEPEKTNEEYLESHLYDWWKSGGWWGELDHSGDYTANPIDDDLTSVVSMATEASEDQSAAELDDGRRTPTQESPFTEWEDDVTEDEYISMSRLSQLLDPKTLEQKDEAKMLASHLQSRHAMTRQQYRRRAELEKVQILAPQLSLSSLHQPMTAEQEEELLEQIILSRRMGSLGGGGTGASWDEGAEGMGANGPQCVVCHSSPRSILVWPCRCLSLCEECRVSLAMNNFGSCVCCRRDVVAFSRLFVP